MPEPMPETPATAPHDAEACAAQLAALREECAEEEVKSRVYGEHKAYPWLCDVCCCPVEAHAMHYCEAFHLFTATMMERKKSASLRAALARAEAENARAAEEGFKIAARLTARVEEAEARAARAEGEREEARAKLDNVQQVCSAATADAQVSRARADAATARAEKLMGLLREARTHLDCPQHPECELNERIERALAGGAA